MTDESVRDKIAKLMRLAVNEGAAPNEAETALRQAEKLMRKHGIELAEIQLETGQKPIYKWSRELVPMAWPKPVKRGPLWMHWTGIGVGKFTDTLVDIIQTPDKGECLRFRGDETDVEYAIWLATHIRNEIRISANIWDAPGANSDQKWANREQYRHSMASRIKARMNALRSEREVEFSRSTALVVVNDKLAQRDHEFGVQTYSHRKRSHIHGSYEAAMAGRAAGDKVQIHRPVAPGTVQKKLT